MSKVIKLLETRVKDLVNHYTWIKGEGDFTAFARNGFPPKARSIKAQYAYGVSGFVRLTITPKGMVKVFYKERSNTHYFIQATFKDDKLHRIECEYSDDIDDVGNIRAYFSNILLRIIGQAFPKV